jgi:uncharacterized membrane protein
MAMIILISLHILAAVIWVGGMFFAYVALRPVAAKLLEPPLRLTLWSEVFKRFFPWVWAVIISLLISGIWMIFNVFGGISNIGPHVHIMLVLGLLMMFMFMHLFFSPYQRLTLAVTEQDWPTAGKALNQIRQIIAINLSLGLIVVAVAASGRYF